VTKGVDAYAEFVGAEVVDMDLDDPRLARPREDRVTEGPLDEAGEDREDVHAHGYASASSRSSWVRFTTRYPSRSNWSMASTDEMASSSFKDSRLRTWVPRA